MALQTHKDLKVYQLSKSLVVKIYMITSSFPKDEIYSLTQQIKRSVISIPSNISEGAARQSNKEYIHFLYIALRSAAELDTQIEIAHELGFLNSDDFKEISSKINEISKMLSGLFSHRVAKP